MARTKDFSYVIGANFTDPKPGRYAWTNQTSSQGPSGIKLSLTIIKRIENVTCSSNSNMGSIAKAMKDALEAMAYSELRDYQRKTIEAYLSGKDVFVSAPTGAGKSLTFEVAPYTLYFLFFFIWRGLQCHRVRDCSVDFLHERSGLKP